MYTSFRIVLTAGIVALVPPAHAQTSPSDFLAELTVLYETMGITLSYGGTETDGEDLILSDVSYSYESVGTRAEITGERMEIRRTDNEVYPLEIIMAPALEMTIDAATIDDGAVPITAVIEYPGNRTLIGGTPEDRLYRFEADALSMRVEDMPLGVADGPTLDMALAMSALSGEARIVRDGDGSLSYTAAGDELSVVYTIGGPDAEFDLTATYSGITFGGSGPLIGATDMLLALASEVETSAGFAVESSAARVSVLENGSQMTIESNSGIGSLDASFGDGVIDYGFESADNRFKVVGGDMPFESAELDAALMSMRIALPVMPRDAASEMAFDLALSDFTVSEEVWALFDPMGALPRDPATLRLEAVSTASALVNFLDPEAMMQADPEVASMPFRFDDLTIREMTLRIAGLELRAEGNAEIRNEGPFPMPVGGLDIRLDGALGLVGKLQEIGLVPPEQAQAAPAMLGMFAKQGEEPDSFTSRIEMTEDGALTANGVQLQ